MHAMSLKQPTPYLYGQTMGHAPMQMMNDNPQYNLYMQQQIIQRQQLIKQMQRRLMNESRANGIKVK